MERVSMMLDNGISDYLRFVRSFLHRASFGIWVSYVISAGIMSLYVPTVYMILDLMVFHENVSLNESRPMLI